MNVTRALPSLLSVKLCLVSFWTTQQPSCRESHLTGFDFWLDGKQRRKCRFTLICCWEWN